MWDLNDDLKGDDLYHPHPIICPGYHVLFLSKTICKRNEMMPTSVNLTSLIFLFTCLIMIFILNQNPISLTFIIIGGC